MSQSVVLFRLMAM